MSELIRRITWSGTLEDGADPHLDQEWLVTNGLGGYASGTVSGISTRRYHGFLVAALPTPLGRMMMLNDIAEQVRLPGRRFFTLGPPKPGWDSSQNADSAALVEFRLEHGLPVWTYAVDGYVIERRVLLPHRQNTVHIRYELVSGEGVLRLGLRPAVLFRSHDGPVSAAIHRPYALSICEDKYEVSGGSDLPPLRLAFHAQQSAFTVRYETLGRTYRIEQSRGYDYNGALWSPGYFRADLSANQPATLVASTEQWETIRALSAEDAHQAELQRRNFLIGSAHPTAREGPAAELVLAADQFIIAPTGRIEDTARARAGGDEIRTVIAGYHWFTDWGRDTMISLEGLTLTTGRSAEAGWILRTFAHYVRNGLIPNLFPEGGNEGLYHTADATLWFFHAIERYLAATHERTTLRTILPKLIDIVDWHLKGTQFNICVDRQDGLLYQGAEGYQLTWMDAKVGDWVVTPRRGKAVEINALWYNALRLLETWVREESGEASARPYAEHAELARESFNRRFWFAEGRYLYDVVDGENGDDSSCRPNQVFAISLLHPVLEESKWKPVLDVVCARLLTPVGLRSLAPGSPDYKSKYYGDLRSRDAAYHQGTVWAWLIGPFIDAWLKVHGSHAEAHGFLQGFVPHLGQQCVGSISEVFDAEPPYTPRGCAAQAWSVAEVLRAWVKTAP